MTKYMTSEDALMMKNKQLMTCEPGTKAQKRRVFL
jgi:hypothetical protein